MNEEEVKDGTPPQGYASSIERTARVVHAAKLVLQPGDSLLVGNTPQRLGSTDTYGPGTINTRGTRRASDKELTMTNSGYRYLFMARPNVLDGSFNKGIWLQGGNGSTNAPKALDKIMKQDGRGYTSKNQQAFIDAVKDNGLVTVYYQASAFSLQGTPAEPTVVEYTWESV